MAVDLERVKRRLAELQNTAEFKKNKILGKLIDFTCKLEQLESDKIYDLRFDIITLRYDIKAIKEITEMYEIHSEWLQEEDLKRVNKIYRTYKSYIRSYEQEI